jgi:hypothetical protein
MLCCVGLHCANTIQDELASAAFEKEFAVMLASSSLGEAVASRLASCSLGEAATSTAGQFFYLNLSRVILPQTYKTFLNGSAEKFVLSFSNSLICISITNTCSFRSIANSSHFTFPNPCN